MRKKVYPSDISLERFAKVRGVLESGKKKTRPREVDLHEVFCGLLYVLKSGCQWRMLPEGFPKWRTVYYYYAEWSKPDQEGVSLLERALKKSGWRGPRQPGQTLHDEFLDRRCAKREEHRERRSQGL